MDWFINKYWFNGWNNGTWQHAYIYISIYISLFTIILSQSIVPTLLDFILRRRYENYATMKDTDMEQRKQLHNKLIKRYLLVYLKGEEQ